jgi:peptide/nickel transport system substrate-binding protein
MPLCAAARPGRRMFSAVSAVCAACAVCVVLAAGGCAATTPPGTPVRASGGTATVALSPGEGSFTWIFPLVPFASSYLANITFSEYLMWRPLYWFGSPGHVGLNQAESLAYPAVITTTGGHTTATITLKPYRWSDGQPVTSRDVQFWVNLLKAGKTGWWDYQPGEFPDNLTAFTILGPRRFSVTFDHPYAAAWLYNELAQLIPLPQQSWDKTSANGKAGNYDLTTAGARAVDAFLLAQNKDLATYASNPLWQVVDGPWRLHSYAPATGDATYVRNTRFSGPATGSLTALTIDSYPSDTAEFDALLSDGGITYGYVPFNDAAQVSRAHAAGYTTQAWPAWGDTWISLNYANPATGPIVKQLYLRQAMQHLINQAAYITSFLQGYGYPGYGPVPLQPASQFVSPQEKHNPYPYDPAQAAALLAAHGWRVVPNGTDTCVRPGTGPRQCGAGIAAGASLSFSLQYATGTLGTSEETAALQSAFRQAGITLALSGAPFSTVVGDDVPCAKAGCWQALYYGQGWYFTPAYNEPDGSAVFGTHAPSNGASYADPHTDTLLARLGSGGLPALYAYQNYLARQLPVLWMPQADYQISAVKSTLHGALPQDPLSNIYPENWYYTKKGT